MVVSWFGLVLFVLGFIWLVKFWVWALPGFCLLDLSLILSLGFSIVGFWFCLGFLFVWLGFVWFGFNLVGFWFGLALIWLGFAFVCLLFGWCGFV